MNMFKMQRDRNKCLKEDHENTSIHLNKINKIFQDMKVELNEEIESLRNRKFLTGSYIIAKNFYICLC